MKSARVVGDVIGKYHPHGDSSAYDAMVRMAQDWSLRYPLIDGQGNFGSRDGDNAAAMRYTEARLTPIAELLLAELDEGTVDWKPNYDGVNDEPCLLPARLPFCLLNGASGIAVGMATEIPATTCAKWRAAAVSPIRNPETSEDDVLAMIPGPTTRAARQIISSPDEIAATYRSGRGSLRVRAKWKIEPLAAASGAWSSPNCRRRFHRHGDVGNRSLPNPVAKEKAGKKVFTPEQLNLKAAFLSAISEPACATNRARSTTSAWSSNRPSRQGRTTVPPAARPHQPGNQRLDQPDGARPPRPAPGQPLPDHRRMVPLPADHRRAAHRHRLTQPKSASTSSKAGRPSCSTSTRSSRSSANRTIPRPT